MFTRNATPYFSIGLLLIQHSFFLERLFFFCFKEIRRTSKETGVRSISIHLPVLIPCLVSVVDISCTYTYGILTRTQSSIIRSLRSCPTGHRRLRRNRTHPEPPGLLLLPSWLRAWSDTPCLRPFPHIHFHPHPTLSVVEGNGHWGDHSRPREYVTRLHQMQCYTITLGAIGSVDQTSENCRRL